MKATMVDSKAVDGEVKKLQARDEQVQAEKDRQTKDAERQVREAEQKRKAEERLEALLLEGLQGDETPLSPDAWRDIRSAAAAQLQKARNRSA